MGNFKNNNQNKVNDFISELNNNNSVKSIALHFNKEILEVCKLIEKFIIILYRRNGEIKEIKIDFLETQSNIKIYQKSTF